ncbi:MAG: class I SAM-dependent methyltransferase, partial [Chloroflexi bacterium]|nr:class I SAM-dependent methyltransferase [Chloroflexota bacterium]
FVCETLPRMNALCSKGFAFNMLTKYSDADRMAQRHDLFYGDPLFFFDFCKRNFSRNAALLHDYGLYDFTILVRKDV